MMSGNINLRECPMCHAGVHDEGVILTAEKLIDPNDGEEYYNIGYTVRCCECGTSVTHEYRDDVVRFWNGETQKDDEDEG